MQSKGKSDLGLLQEMIIEAKIVRMTKTTMFVISVLALVIHQFRNVEMTNTSIELEYRHT